MSNQRIFEARSGFCPDCGSILPPIRDKADISCYTCSSKFSTNDFDEVTTKYTIHFNSRDSYTKNTRQSKKQNDDEEGPIVERKCLKCGNERMSYATLQLRSADEGQTVFYTCTQCKYKESENS